jgi:3-oxoacyl-[acyl-carrier-protein] synthase-1
MVFPNLNFREKIDELHFEPVKELISGIELKHVLSNSFGFGGNDSTLIFSAC